MQPLNPAIIITSMNSFRFFMEFPFFYIVTEALQVYKITFFSTASNDARLALTFFECRSVFYDNPVNSGCL